MIEWILAAIVAIFLPLIFVLMFFSYRKWKDIRDNFYD